MKVYKWIQVCSTVCLAVACLWGMTGCGGSDGDGGGTTGGTTTAVVTNEPEAPAVQALVAPQQVMPSEGQEFATIAAFSPVDVKFQWTAVPGAAYYLLEAAWQTWTVNGTTKTLPLSLGDYKWRVNAVDDSGAKGPVSGWLNFAVIFQPPVVNPI